MIEVVKSMALADHGMESGGSIRPQGLLGTIKSARTATDD